MTDEKFVSLAALLDGWYESDLGNLPDELRQRLEEEGPPSLWDRMSPAQRLSWAQQADYHNNPANDEHHEYWFNHFVDKRAKEHKLKREQARTYSDPDKAEKQESRCMKLQSELDFMTLQEKYPDAPHRILKEYHSGTGTTEKLERILSNPDIMKTTCKTLEDIDNGTRKSFENIQCVDGNGQPLNGDKSSMADQEESDIIGKVLLEAEFFPIDWRTIKKWLLAKGVKRPLRGKVWRAPESVCREIKADKRNFIQNKIKKRK